eukprot:gene2677-5569_t
MLGIVAISRFINKKLSAQSNISSDLHSSKAIQLQNNDLTRKQKLQQNSNHIHIVSPPPPPPPPSTHISTAPAEVITDVVLKVASADCRNELRS